MEKSLSSAIILIIILSGCTQAYLIESFSFNSAKGTCTSKEDSTAEMNLTGNKIKFSGYIITPTPCHKLKSTYWVETVDLPKAPKTDVISIKIEKEADESDFCVQCLGEIPFNGELIINKDMWDTGNYGVEIIYEGKELARLYNYVV